MTDIWVSNTSPLIYISKADLLHDLYRGPLQTVNIPDGVYAEAVRDPKTFPDHARIEKARNEGWLKVHSLTAAQKQESISMSSEILRNHNLRVEPVDAECMILQRDIGGRIIYANSRAERAAGHVKVSYSPLHGYLKSLRGRVDDKFLIKFAKKIFDVGYQVQEMKDLIRELDNP